MSGTTRPVEDDRRPWRRALAYAAAVAAALVAALAVATHLVAAQAEETYPAVGRFVEVDGRRLHYVDEGRGPPVVLLHGAFGGLDDWRATILPELARSRRVVALDRPGHGHSERGAGDVSTPVAQGRIVRAFLREIGVQRPVLVGFSWSGPLVLSMALEHPREVRACVTVNGATHPWPDPLEKEYTLPTVPVVGDAFVELLVAPVGALLSDDAVEKAFSPRPVPPHFERSPVALSLRPAAYRAEAADIRALRPCTRELSKRYGELQVPVVVLVGEGDLVAGPRIHSYPLAEQAQRAELIRVADGGHQLPYSHPGEVLRAIDRAFETTAR